VSVHDVIAKVAANDAGLQTVDLSSSAIFQVRLSRFLPSFLLSSSRILPLLAHFANPFLALERAGDEQQLTEGDIVKTLCNGALPAPLSMSPEMSRWVLVWIRRLRALFFWVFLESVDDDLRRCHTVTLSPFDACTREVGKVNDFCWLVGGISTDEIGRTDGSALLRTGSKHAR